MSGSRWRHGAVGLALLVSGSTVFAVAPELTAASAVKSATGVNLVPNPSFETDTTSWNTFNLSTFARETSWASSGFASLHAVGAVASAKGDYVVVGTNSIPVVPGLAYTAAADVNGIAIPANSSTHLQLYWLDKNRAGLANTATSTTVTGVKALEVTGTAPADTAAVQVRIFSYSQSGALWDTYIDNVRLTAPSPLPTHSCLGLQATIEGTPQADRLKGTAKADVIVGLGGADRVSGLKGNDRVCGGPGGDTLSGGPSKDRISGGTGPDHLFGGPGADALMGGPGKDTQTQ